MTTYLVDTNVLLSLVDPQRPQHSTAQAAVEALRRQGDELVVCFQNCAEFWNVATRPTSKNGLGFSTNTAVEELSRIERAFVFAADPPNVYSIWRQLLVTYGVSGVQVHDARLAAAMIGNSIKYILTFNAADFVRYANAGVISVGPLGISQR
ncbi:MAG: PIN domain-containing protein [Anaerolineae bacterium]